MKRFLVLISLVALSLPSFVFAASDIILNIEFPADGQVRYSDDFGDSRSGGRAHEGIDIMGEQMMPLIATTDGRITYLTETESSWGWSLTLKDNAGWKFKYLHLNNDTPGTDDGNGGFFNAFAPGIYRGAYVKKGQVIGYMGDSGNAEWTSHHVHFEIHAPGRGPINPYLSLVNASRANGYSPEAELAIATNINSDKEIKPTFAAKYCLSDTLITTPTTEAVYYCGKDGKRYAFPNGRTYFTWYDDFSRVQTISPEELSVIPLGGTVTYRPGSRLVKITSDPRVYAVGRGGILRHISSESVAEGLYGRNWSQLVEDVPDAFFASYQYGPPINYASST